MSVSSATEWAWTATSFLFTSGYPLTWTSGDASATGIVTGISSLSAAALAVGNGTQGDFTGTLKLSTLNSVTNYQLNGITSIFATAPTVTSAGTSPSVTASNGTATFRVNVGTGGTATTIVMAMPTATTGWNCYVNNLTGAAANRAAGVMVEQSSTVSSVTVQYQTVATGTALAFTASDIVGFICMGF
jgi:hypothetical protein